MTGCTCGFAPCIVGIVVVMGPREIEAVNGHDAIWELVKSLPCGGSQLTQFLGPCGRYLRTEPQEAGMHVSALPQ